MRKIFLLIVAMIAVSYYMDAQCISGSCETGNGTYLFADGSQYSGAFVKGLPDGEGEWIYPKGEKVKGLFKKGLPVGEETFAKTNSHSKQGCLSGNCKNGIGIKVDASGEKYVGYFKNSQPYGKGTYYYLNGSRYNGHWKNGLRHGKGALHQNGGIQKGVWKNDLLDYTTNEDHSDVQEIISKNRYAVVIGIAEYQKMDLLDFADDDAYSFYQYLENDDKNTASENIRFLIDQNATALSIKNALTEVAEKAGPNDEIIIYFSGHGIAKAIIPFESDGKTGLVTHEDISHILSQSAATSTLFLDACNKLENEANISQLKGLGDEVTVFYSSSLGQNSLESNELKQGVFSYFLVQGLKGAADSNSNGNISDNELFGYIYDNVQRYTEQRQFPTMAARVVDPFGK